MEKNKSAIIGRHLLEYEKYLTGEEHAEATVKKYIRDVRAFLKFSKWEISKERTVEWKNAVAETYKAASVNSMIAAVNGFFRFYGADIQVKPLKIQRTIFLAAEKELTRKDYEKLLDATKERKNERLFMLIQTLAATGIRISELKFITVEAVAKGLAEVKNKGKTRTVFISKDLKRALLKYAKAKKISRGAVFVTKNGGLLDRSNVWSELKRLCRSAGVSPEKVFPHNFRHLFASVFYKKERDITKLADILGHSDVNTTRIYVMQQVREYRRSIEQINLVRLTT